MKVLFCTLVFYFLSFRLFAQTEFTVLAQEDFSEDITNMFSSTYGTLIWHEYNIYDGMPGVLEIEYPMGIKNLDLVWLGSIVNNIDSIVIESNIRNKDTRGYLEINRGTITYDFADYQYTVFSTEGTELVYRNKHVDNFDLAKYGFGGSVDVKKTYFPPFDTPIVLYNFEGSTTYEVAGNSYYSGETKLEVSSKFCNAFFPNNLESCISSITNDFENFNTRSSLLIDNLKVTAYYGNITGLNLETNKIKKIEGVYNVLGQRVDPNYLNNIVIVKYIDGTSERMHIENFKSLYKIY